MRLRNESDNLAPPAKAKIPILSVIGDVHDWIVPIMEFVLKHTAAAK